MDTFTLLGGALTLSGPRPPEDALWLAAAVPPLPPGATVLEAGTGSGVLSLALLHHQPHLRVTGLDVAVAPAAVANAALNRQSLSVLSQNLFGYHPSALYQTAVSNPPFHLQHSPSPVAAKNLAHAATPQFLQNWLAALFALTTPTGSVHLVVHAAALPHLQAVCAPYHSLVRPLATHPQNPPKRALLHVSKNQPPGWHQTPPIPAHSPSLRAQVLHLGKPLAPA